MVPTLRMAGDSMVTSRRNDEVMKGSITGMRKKGQLKYDEHVAAEGNTKEHR